MEDEHLDGLLKKKPGKEVKRDFMHVGAPPDDYSLPAEGEPYRAFGRAMAKPIYSLHCLMGKDGCRTFPYHLFDGDSTFKADKNGQVMKLRFSGTKIWEITVTGVDLWRCYDLIMQHRMPWISRADRAFTDGKEPIITGIHIAVIDPETGKPEDNGKK